MKIVLELDRVEASHLAVALEFLRAACDESRRPMPVALQELRLGAIAAARDVADATDVGGGHDDRSHDEPPEVLTRAEFADRRDVSVRTVDRWIETGRIVCGIPATELDRLKGRCP